MREQRILAVAGTKNAGKTTLIEGLIPCFAARGVTVATVKHDGHRFEADRPGTDSFRHLAAGACGTAVFDGEKFQLVKTAAVTERELIACFPEAELVLLEGFKHSSWPKLEIVRKAVSEQRVCGEETLLALVTDCDDPATSVPCFGLGDTEKLADYLYALLWGGD